MLRAVKAIERASVVALVLNASEGVTAQDTHLAGYARDEAKGLLFVANKWDLMPRDRHVRDAFEAQVREDMKFAPFAPLRFVSARQTWHVDEVLATAWEIAEERRKRIPTAVLNDLIAEAVHAHGPPSDHGRSLKIYYVTQVAINPPTFVFFVNDATLLHFGYQRFLENRVREAFGFAGTAIRLIFRTRVDERAAQRV